MLFPFPLSQYGQEHYKHLWAQGISPSLTQNSFLLPLPLFLPGANKEQLCTASTELCHPWAKDVWSTLFPSPVHSPAFLAEVQGSAGSHQQHPGRAQHGTAWHSTPRDMGRDAGRLFLPLLLLQVPAGRISAIFLPYAAYFPFPSQFSYMLYLFWFLSENKFLLSCLRQLALHLVCTVHHHLLSCHEPISKCFSCWWLLAMMYEAETKPESQRLQKGRR